MMLKQPLLRLLGGNVDVAGEKGRLKSKLAKRIRPMSMDEAIAGIIIE